MKKLASFLVLFGALGVQSLVGQSTCECAAYGCSVSQSCPPGYIASCSCTASGCTGQCVKAGSELPELMLFETGGQNLIAALIGSNEKSISAEFTKNIGREVAFTKSPDVETLVGDAPSFKSYWEVAEFLAGKGKLVINKLPFAIWKGHRDVLLEGGEYNICANDLPARMILDEINFLTGRNFRIVSGDPRSKAKVLIHGKNLKEVLESLSSSRNIKIVDVDTGQMEVTRK